MFMNTLEKLKQSFPLIEQKISYSFSNSDLLTLAFTHRSFINENKELVSEHNERLEFLGDAVLSLIISGYLYHHLPLTREGELSYLRAQIVDATTCASFSEKLNLHSYILLGKGEMQNFGKGKESIYADLFEALLGAIYLDGGLEAARVFVLSHFESEIQKTILQPTKNWKAELQDYAQRKFHMIPLYEVEKEIGPDHDKIFHVDVFIGEKKWGAGFGPSKKKAQQMAARDALENILDKDQKENEDENNMDLL